MKVDKNFLNKAKNLKFIYSPSTGIDHVDLIEAKKKELMLFILQKKKI